MNIKNESSKNILFAFLLNFSFTIIEVVGGLITGSTAIMADAIHDLGDSISLIISYIISKFAKQKATNKFTFGFKRLNVFGALLNIIILATGTILMSIETFKAFNHHNDVLTLPMIVIAFIGALINGLSVLKLKHSNNILNKSVAIHLMEDFLGWIVILIGSIIIHYTKLYILDPIMSLLIIIIISRNIIINFKKIMEILLNANSDSQLAVKIKEQIYNINKVIEITDFHLWSEDGEYYTLALSITTTANKTNNLIKNIKRIIKKQNIEHSIIEVITIK